MDKKDLPATKGDLAELETRLEKKFASRDDRTSVKGDIARLDAKIDAVDARLDAKIDSSTKRLAVEISRTNGRIDELGQSLTRTIHQQSDRILTALDRYSKVVEADNRGVTLHGSILTNVQLKLQDHSRRIQALESGRPQP
ncbi:MAG: hypothetical protein HY922_12335 [Elusimicrobia bacterium]|nr:hypothetical protein [Elusimicrobiota bacterium]